MGDHPSQRHKPNSTSQGWKDLYDSHDFMAKHNYPSMNSNPKV
jgi:hypothetical protein